MVLKSKACLAEWLKDKCKQKNLSLRQASQKTSLSHSAIRGLMQGSTASRDTVKKLARGFANGNGHHQIMLLEDKLLVLAGYKEEETFNLSEPVARLLDIISDFSEKQLKIMTRFADFLVEVEQER